MKTYRYSFLSKLLYRYGNIPLTFLLLIYLATSAIGFFSHWYFIFFFFVNLTIIVWLNKYYIKTYQHFPFTISADNEKMICSSFFFSKRSVEIKFSDIDEIRGGIFSGFQTRPIYIHDSRQNITVGFYSQVGDFKQLLTTILKNIPQELYDKLLQEMKGEK